MNDKNLKAMGQFCSATGNEIRSLIKEDKAERLAFEQYVAVRLAMKVYKDRNRSVRSK